MIGTFVCVVALSVLGAESAIRKSGSKASRDTASQRREIFYYDHGQLRVVKNNKKVRTCTDEYSGSIMYCYADEIRPWAGNAIVIPELYTKNKTEAYSYDLAREENLGVMISPYNARSRLGRFCYQVDPQRTYDVLPFGWVTVDVENRRPCCFDWLIINNKIKMILRYLDYDKMREFKTLESTKELGEVDFDGYKTNPVFINTRDRYSVVNHEEYIENVIEYHNRHKEDWRYDQSLV